MPVPSTSGVGGGGGGGVLDRRDALDLMHGCSRRTIDPRIRTMSGWSTSGFHRPGRHCWLAPSAKHREMFRESHEG